MTTVREFVEQSYSLVSSHSPTVPLHGSDLSTGIAVMNRLLRSYGANGLRIAIAKTVNTTIVLGQGEITFADAGYTPTPTFDDGRLANLNSAWLELNGMNYPLVQASRDKFLASYHYNPLQGLPRFIYVFPDTNVVTVRLYPAPSQSFEFYLRGKFQLPLLTSDDDMSIVPEYSYLWLQFAVAKYVSYYKGRSEAWTQKLESDFRELQNQIDGASEVNLAIVGANASLLNGSWRVQSGT